MKLYLYGALVLISLGACAYIVHLIKEDARDEVKIETAKVQTKVQGAKDAIRSKPITNNDVVNSLREGTW